MNRRSFAQSMGGAAALSALVEADAAPARKTRIYRLDTYHLRQGTRAARLNEFFTAVLPLLQKNSSAVGAFTTVFGPQVPATVLLTGFAGLDEMEAADQRMRRAPEYQAALEKLESASEPPYDSVDRVLVRAFDMSPEIVAPAEKPRKPRFFELRVYHAPTERQFALLQDRFTRSEIGIFHRCGIFPALYGTTLAGPNLPNVTYLTPFASLAEREKAWDAFAVDPVWLKLREESAARSGQIIDNISILLLRAATYSPMQ